MDIDMLKSTPCEDQMEMMLMMQLDKYPDFSNGNYSELPVMEFSPQGSCNSNSSSNNNYNFPHQIDHNNTSSFLNMPSNTNTISFSNSPIHQEPSSSALPFMLNSGIAPGGISFSNATKRSNMAAMREMIFRIAAMQPIHIDPESVKPPKRRNVKISTDPQSVAARHRRERISERIRILQRLVPGGTKMDTASMLDEAIHYVKFLKNQVQSLERAGVNNSTTRPNPGLGFPVPMSLNGNNNNYLHVMSSKNYQQYADA